MLIWSGLGFLVALITFFSLFLTQKVVGEIFSDPQYYSVNGWPKLLGFLVAAGVTYLLSLRFSRNKGRVLIDKVTGKEVVFKRRHTLFFIDIKYWPLILIAVGIVFLFVK